MLVKTWNCQSAVHGDTMSRMKRKFLTALPEVFSLAPNSDYSRFIVESDPTVAMKRTWCGIGKRLRSATKKIGKDVEKTARRD